MCQDVGGKFLMARQIDIFLQEDTTYTPIKYLTRFHSYLNLIQLILHKRITLAFSIFWVFLFQHVYIF